MVEIYERLRYSQALSTYFPSEAVPLLPGMDPREDFYATDHRGDIADFSLVLPSANPSSGDVEIWLPMVFALQAKNKAAVLTISTGAGGSGALTKITGSATLTASQVRIYPGMERFDFHSSLAGTRIYFNGKIVGTPFNIQMMRRLFAELRATQQEVITLMASGSLSQFAKSFTANTDIAAGRFCTLNSDDKLIYAGNTQEHLAPFGYAVDAISAAAQGTIIAAGFVVGGFTGLIHGQPIYIKNDSGEYTQDQADLDDYDHVFRVGRAWGSTNAYLNCNGPDILLKKDVS